MGKMISTDQELLDILKIKSFRNLSKGKMLEFISLIPNMDREFAIERIKQFPEYAKFATEAIANLSRMCDTAIKESANSQRETIEAYKLILDSLGDMLKKDSLSSDERQWISTKMVEVADKIAAKDSEQKHFIEGIVKHGTNFIGGAICLGLLILGGVNYYKGCLPGQVKQ